MLLLSNLMGATAQENTAKKERRIYLWDVTISMVGATTSKSYPLANPSAGVGNPIYSYDEKIQEQSLHYNEKGDIYDSTREALINSIKAIEDKDCQIVVLPYDKEIRTVFEVPSATDQNKEAIIKQIETWSALHKAGTYTGKCLAETIDKHFKSGRLNRVILLTDGSPDDADALFKIVRAWDKNAVDSRYVDNRLVYVMLTKVAADDEVKEEFDKKGEESGVTTISSLEDLQKYVSFSLSNLSHEKVIEQSLSDFNIDVDCNIVAAFGSPDKIRCVFETNDPMINVVDSTPVAPKDGKFRIRVKFAYGSRDEYRQALGNKVHHAVIKCSVAPGLEDVTLEGNDEIKVDLSINAQPKAVVRISRK